MTTNFKSSTTKKNIIYTAPATGIVYEPHQFRGGHFRMGLPMADANGLNFRKRKMARNEIVVKTEADLLKKLAEGYALRMRPVAEQRTRNDQPVRRKARMTPAQSIMVDGKPVWEKTANGESDKAKARKEQTAKKTSATKAKKPAPKKKDAEAVTGLDVFKSGQQKAA